MARRSDIAKLVSKAREVWRQSQNYQAAKKACREINRPDYKGWFRCAMCQAFREVIKVDHIDPIGKQPETMGQFGEWLERLFCPITNLQGLCNDCHREKTREEGKARRAAVKKK